MKSFAGAAALAVVLLMVTQGALGASVWRDNGDSFKDGTYFQTIFTDRGIALAANTNIAINWTAAVIQPDGRNCAAMAYDTTNGNALLFGGYDGSKYLNDTWSYNSTTGKWTKKNPATSPAARARHGMVYDADQGRFLMFGGTDASKLYDDTWTYTPSTGTWASVNPGTKPSARSMFGMSYDSKSKLTVLFGGHDGSNALKDTWRFDAIGGTWEKQPTSGSPSARYLTATVFDGSLNETVLFGGIEPAAGCYSQPNLVNDTWTYSSQNNTWTNRTTGLQPSARHSHVMAYDSDRKLTLLYSGAIYIGMLYGSSDVWKWNSSFSNWGQISPSNTPPTRMCATSAYDPVNNHILVFGGTTMNLTASNEFLALNRSNNAWYAPGAPEPRDDAALVSGGSGLAMMFGGAGLNAQLADTWVFNDSLGTWQMKNPTSSPSARESHAMAFDDRSGAAVLFGGAQFSYMYPNAYCDTWVYNFSTGDWSNKNPPSIPTARYQHAMAYDHGNSRTVLFGGITGNFMNQYKNNETWVYSTGSNIWDNKTPVDSPARRSGHAMAYDPASGLVVLFGGYNESYSYENDTWVYNTSANTWTQRKPADAPGPRQLHSMAYDSVSGEIILFGGQNANGALNTTWSYNVSNNIWTKLQCTSTPSKRSGQGMASLGPAGGVLVYGGNNSGEFPSLQTGTWKLRPSTTIYLDAGTFISVPMDTNGSAYYGNLSWCATVPSGTEFKLQLRSADTRDGLNTSLFKGPDGTNGTWYNVSGMQMVHYSHKGSRWIQYKAKFTTTNPAVTPSLASVQLPYNLMHNVTVTAPTDSQVVNGTFNITWNASDPDGDTLNFTIYLISYPNESYVLKLASDLNNTARRFEWNTSGVPDGNYTLRIESMDNCTAIPLKAKAFLGPFAVKQPVQPPVVEPPMVELLSPADGITVQTNSVNITWAAREPPGTPQGSQMRFTIYLCTTSFPPSKLPLPYDTAGEPSYTLRMLESTMTYYWTVMASLNGTNSTIAEVRSFNVSIPVTPGNNRPVASLSSPEDSAILQTANVELGWSGSDADGDPLLFHLFLQDSTIDYKRLPAPLKTTNLTTYLAAGLADGKTYWWSVRPDDGKSLGDLVAQRHFTVKLPTNQNNNPPFTYLKTPNDGAKMSSTSVQLAWTGEDAESDPLVYYLYLSNASFNLAGLPPRLDWTNATSYILKGLVNGQTYYWTVIPHDGKALGNASEVRKFTIDTSVVNRNPVIASYPANLTAMVGIEFIYNISAEDDDGDPLTYILVSGVKGMGLDNVTNGLYWTPNQQQLGNHTIKIAVSDGRGGLAEQEIVLNVIRYKPPELPTPPVCSVIFPTPYETVSGKIVINGTGARGTNLTFQVLLKIDNGPWKEATGSSDWYYTLDTGTLKNGNHLLHVKATDGSLSTKPLEIPITVKNPQTSRQTTNMLTNFGILLVAAVAAVGAYAYWRRRKNAASDRTPAKVPFTTDTGRPVSGSATASGAMPPAPRDETPEVKSGVLPSSVYGGDGAASGATAGGAGMTMVTAKPLRTAPADFAIEDIFLMYKDGRLIHHATRRIKADMDVEIITSMLKAVQDFVRDSFGRAEGSELGAMEYGDSKILLQKGEHTILAAVILGSEPSDLRSEMRGVINNIEAEYQTLLIKWNGLLDSLSGVKKFLSALGTYRTPDETGEKLSKDVSLLSELEFYQGFVRAKVAIKNNMATVIRNTSLKVVFDEDSLRLDHLEPAFAREGRDILFGDVEPRVKKTVALYLDPQICTESHLEGILTYKDAMGHLESVKLPRKLVSVVCPIMFTDENINTAMLKRMAVEELDKKDSKVFSVPEGLTPGQVFDIGKTSVQHHDVRLVREFEERNPFIGEAWYYGKAKGRTDKMIIRVRVLGDRKVLEFHVAASSTLMLTGMLAELKSDLNKSLKALKHEGKMKRVSEEETLNAVTATKTLLDKSMEDEAPPK